MDQPTIDQTLLTVARRRYAGPRSVRLLVATELCGPASGHIIVGVVQVGGDAPLGTTRYLGCKPTPEPEAKGTEMTRAQYFKLLKDET